MFGIQKYHFKVVGENEKVVKVIHRHWIDILLQLLVALAIMAALAGSLFVFPFIFPQLQEKEFYSIFLFLETVFGIFIWIYVFLIWIDYYLDIWIITDERIINIEQRGLFMRNVSELRYERVQDVTAEVEGFLQTIFNFGDVHIQTAGETPRFFFRQVPDPYGIKSMIMNFHKKREKIK
jgi:uncharacterized membrane protein YdbT with pleckstrin-like domain